MSKAKAVVESTRAVSDYGEWLRDRVRGYIDFARKSIDQSGEKGRVGEAVVAAALREFLPRRFSLGSGFIINNRGCKSTQQDIVIYDETLNTPILFEGGAGLFPIECVYATIEVKLSINRRGLQKTLESIAEIRRMAAAKQFIIEYKKVIGPHGGSIAEPVRCIRNLAPRTFVFADKVSGLDASVISDLLGKHPDAVLHGAAFMEPKWFLMQEAFDKTRALKSEETQDKVFTSFLLKVRHSIQSIRMEVGDIDPYIHRDAPVLPEILAPTLPVERDARPVRRTRRHATSRVRG